MLRCGQMILAEALVRRHLGRGMCVYHSVPRFSSSYVDTEVMHNICFFLEWRWVRGQQPREEYMSILNAFIDKKDSYYSIHQIGKSQSCVVYVQSTGRVYKVQCIV